MADDLSTYRGLYGTVRMLASDASHQAAYLITSSEHAKCQILADDITTEFCCWLRHAPQLLDAGLLSNTSFDRLRKLADMISDVPHGAEHWTAEALSGASFWSAVREQARVTLTSMDEPSAPNVS